MRRCGDLPAIPTHPANFGRLCSKGSALGETLASTAAAASDIAAGRRLAYAHRWDAALDRVADGLRDDRRAPRPDAVAFYLSGQLLTEDYYVANKLMKGFIGSANVDTNSRLCMASSVAGHRRAFGADTVPGTYRGSRRGRSHRAGRLQRRLVPSGAVSAHDGGASASAARKLVVDRSAPHRDRAKTPICSCRSRRAATPRCSAACLRISPTRGALDYALYRAPHQRLRRSAGARARDRAGSPRPHARPAASTRPTSRASSSCFAKTERVVTCYSQGVNQSAQGTDKVNAIINVPSRHRPHRPARHGAVLAHRPAQRHGRPRSRRPRQPARRAYGLSRPTSATASRRFWNAPRMAAHEGLKAVDMFEAIERGAIKALWVMATNPAVSLPRAGAVRAALAKLDLFVVSDNVVEHRHHRLPAHMCCCRPRPGARRTAPSPIPSAASRASARSCRRPARRGRIGGSSARSRAASASARPSTIADAADIFREHAALSAFENDGRARLRHRRASPPCRMTPTTRSSRCCGRCRAGEDTRRRAVLRRRRLLYRRRPRALRRAGAAGAARRRPSAVFRCGSTPAACATSGTP